MSQRLKHHLKLHFIPHAGNNYLPHFLHTKRAIFYSIFLVGLKVIMVGFIVLMPAEVFGLPDVLLNQRDRVITLANDLRVAVGKPPLRVASKLGLSAGFKATDMATYSYFSHVGPDGKSLPYFLKEAGYQYRVAGENLAMGFHDAEELMAAWKESPTHYQNIIDADFVEDGVGMQSGAYDNLPTVYVAMHFGQPKVALVKTTAAVTPTATTTIKVVKKSVPLAVVKPVATTLIVTRAASSSAVVAASSTTLETTPATPEVLGKIVTNEEPVATMSGGVIYDRSHSQVSWQEIKGGVAVTARAALSGNIRSAYVEVDNHRIQLAADSTTTYAGSLAIPIGVDKLFNVVIDPAIVIIDTAGHRTNDTIPWSSLKIVSPTPIEKYLLASRDLPMFGSIFSFSQSIYLIFLAIFSVALVLSIFLEIRRQHPHIILQTLGLIGMLAALLLF